MWQIVILRQNAAPFTRADTPVDEEYTRNMAVGASFADLAVHSGKKMQVREFLTQTRRHTRICPDGNQHFVFAIFKKWIRMIISRNKLQKDSKRH